MRWEKLLAILLQCVLRQGYSAICVSICVSGKKAEKRKGKSRSASRKGKKAKKNMREEPDPSAGPSHQAKIQRNHEKIQKL